MIEKVNRKIITVCIKNCNINLGLGECYLFGIWQHPHYLLSTSYLPTSNMHIQNWNIQSILFSFCRSCRHSDWIMICFKLIARGGRDRRLDERHAALSFHMFVSIDTIYRCFPGNIETIKLSRNPQLYLPACPHCTVVHYCL